MNPCTRKGRPRVCVVLSQACWALRRAFQPAPRVRGTLLLSPSPPATPKAGPACARNSQELPAMDTG